MLLGGLCFRFSHHVFDFVFGMDVLQPFQLHELVRFGLWVKEKTLVCLSANWCVSCECTLVWNLVSLKLAVQFTCITLYELHSYYTRLEPVFLKFSVECTHAWSLVSLKLVV